MALQTANQDLLLASKMLLKKFLASRDVLAFLVMPLMSIEGIKIASQWGKKKKYVKNSNTSHDILNVVKLENECKSPMMQCTLFDSHPSCIGRSA